MSQPPLPPPPQPLHPPNTLPATNIAAMAETQKLPLFPPPNSFNHYPHRRLPQPVPLPPLEIPPDAVQPRSDYAFRSPVNQLPSIHPGPPPPRHSQHHSSPQHQPQQQQQHHHQQQPPSQSHPQHQHQPPSLPRAAPVEKLLHPNPYTPPRSDPPYSPQQYGGPSISPRSEFDSRGPRRLAEQRYPYEDGRPHPHHDQQQQHQPHQQHQHQQPYASLASPVEPSQQQKVFAPLPSPSTSYTPSFTSSSTPFRGSVGSHSHSHRGSVNASLGPLAYPEHPTPGVPPRQERRVIPLPGSIPQPVLNPQL